MLNVDQSLTLADYRAQALDAATVRLAACRGVMMGAEENARWCREQADQAGPGAFARDRYHELALLHEGYALALRGALEGEK